MREARCRVVRVITLLLDDRRRDPTQHLINEVEVVSWNFVLFNVLRRSNIPGSVRDDHPLLFSTHIPLDTERPFQGRVLLECFTFTVENRLSTLTLHPHTCTYIRAHVHKSQPPTLHSPLCTVRTFLVP